MHLTNRQQNGLLYVVEGLGAVFAILFVSVYIAGLKDVPKNVVYHSEPILRMTLAGLGVLLIILALVSIGIVFVSKRKTIA